MSRACALPVDAALRISCRTTRLPQTSMRSSRREHSTCATPQIATRGGVGRRATLRGAERCHWFFCCGSDEDGIQFRFRHRRLVHAGNNSVIMDCQHPPGLLQAQLSKVSGQGTGSCMVAHPSPSDWNSKLRNPDETWDDSLTSKCAQRTPASGNRQ